MTCREAADFLMDYVAGTLPLPVVVRFRAHLAVCRNCRAFLAQYRATVEAGKAAFSNLDADAATAMPEDLVKSILAAVGAKT